VVKWSTRREIRDSIPGKLDGQGVGATIAIVPLSLYLHIPFCTVRCGYCDFNTYSGLESLIPDYVDALVEEVRLAGEGLRRHSLTDVHTVYLGGGTPSLLEVDQVARIMAAVRDSFDLRRDAEITLEANPGTVDEGKLAGLRGGGVNRLSMGAQSRHEEELALLDRVHGPGDVESAVRRARRTGFQNISLDLMYGLPRQTCSAWEASLRWAIGLGVDHISLYALTLEYGTPLQHQVGEGALPAPDPDRAAEMYEAATDLLAANAYLQYEISNWARNDSGVYADRSSFACLHNLQYWRNEPYLGLGAGAHGFALGWRYDNVRSPRAYLDRIRRGVRMEAPCTPAMASRRAIGRPEEMDDTMMLGFRLTSEGIDVRRFAERYGEDPQARYRDRLQDLGDVGLIEQSPERLRLTRHGRILGNQVFQAFV
jgi:oxygen-independent coproporphyrinogen-3 oxidase